MMHGANRMRLLLPFTDMPHHAHGAGLTTQVEKEAARAAAAAEAEAAADVCTVCGLAWGSAAQLDGLWVWCGTCKPLVRLLLDAHLFMIPFLITVQTQWCYATGAERTLP